MKTKEYERWIKFRISESQLAALREEATNQRIGVSSLIRDCIDQHLDPELRLKSIIDNRSVPIVRLRDEVFPQLDEVEMHEYNELTLATGANEEAQIEWLLAKKAQLEVPAVATEPVSEQDKLPIDELLKEFKDRA